MSIRVSVRRRVRIMVRRGSVTVCRVMLRRGRLAMMVLVAEPTPVSPVPPWIFLLLAMLPFPEAFVAALLRFVRMLAVLASFEFLERLSLLLRPFLFFCSTFRKSDLVAEILDKRHSICDVCLKTAPAGPSGVRLTILFLLIA